MDARQMELVKSSMDQVATIADTAAALFYQRLFELDPSLRALFPGDMQVQGRKLMAMLRLVVAHLPELERIQAGVAMMGRRHEAYGVEPAHYETVGQAFLWTLAQGLGDAFTTEVENAWATAYGVLSEMMLANETLLDGSPEPAADERAARNGDAIRAADSPLPR